MAELRRAEARDGLYARLLQRLALALDEADSVSRLDHGSTCELELRGLSPAELELIRAYQERDLHWLRGWHAAAEELALIEQTPQCRVKSIRVGNKLAGKPKALPKHRQKLLCALCGKPAHWQPGEGVQACLVCGSQLFRAGNPR